MLNILADVRCKLGKSTPNKSSTYRPMMDLLQWVITRFTKEETRCQAVTLPAAPKGHVRCWALQGLPCYMKKITMNTAAR